MLLPALYTTHAVTKWPGLEPMTDWEVFQEQNVWQNNQYAEGMNKQFSGFSGRNSRISAFDRFMKKNHGFACTFSFYKRCRKFGRETAGHWCLSSCLAFWHLDTMSCSTLDGSERADNQLWQFRTRMIAWELQLWRCLMFGKPKIFHQYM